MLTPTIIDSIIKQYEESASLFSTTPELITLLRNILKKPDYRNFRNSSATKLLQKEDLWQIASAWDKNENLFNAYTYQGNPALKKSLRIFKAFKNNQMLTEQNIDILYSEDDTYYFLKSCVDQPLELSDNPEGNAILDFIVHQIKDRKKWDTILKFLNTHKLLTLENLQRIKPHIDSINTIISKITELQSPYGHGENLANIIVGNPESANIITNFYLKNKWRDNIGDLLVCIRSYKINDEASLNELLSFAFTNLLFAKNYSDRLTDSDVINFVYKISKTSQHGHPLLIFYAQRIY